MGSTKEKGKGEEVAFLGLRPYNPPTWALNLRPIPSHAFTLAHVPTPIHKWNLPDLPKNTQVYIKRDDLCGVQLSGNKARKLEFLLAEAVSLASDCVITIGGIQSNHCRATAAAAKYLNLDCFLILCTSESQVDKDPGLSGNLLIERLVGAHVELTSWEDFKRLGSGTLLNSLKEKLVKNGRRPYVIPVGASNPLGSWGYIEAIHEIEQQVWGSDDLEFDAIVAACGSGGTIAGLSLGSQLSTLKAKVHAFSVGDTLENYYTFIQDLLDGLESNLKSRDVIDIQDAKGVGYSVSTAEEFRFIKEVAESTGVILDPVYSGKAAYVFWKEMKEKPSKWEDKKVLFIHTGGLFGLYDKANKDMCDMVGRWKRLEINDSLNEHKDASHYW